MTQVKTDILLNGMRLEIHPSKLTKCGEIHINDDCTSAFLFCAFCSDEDDPDIKFFRTLSEFIDHIRWHRSDDLQYLQSPTSPKDTAKVLFETLDDDSRSNLSPPQNEADDITDWIAPPEELFELNTISNFIEMDSHAESVEANETRDETVLAKNEGNVINPAPSNAETTENKTSTKDEEEKPEISGEVFIELLNLFKKCPGVWHTETAAKTSPETVEAVYKLLTAHYNQCAKENEPVEYVKGIVAQIKNCFLEEYKDVEYSMNDSMDCLPWYFPYLSFLLDSDSNELDKSIFTDFVCPICRQEESSQEDLWSHLCQVHLELEDVDDIPNDIEDTNNLTDGKYISWGHYPRNILEKFIEIYRSQTRLWDKSNDEYYSRPLRRQSYDMLLKILREYDPEATRAEVVSKINQLRTQFAYDRQKILSSKNTHVSRSWFYDKLKFLVGNMTKKPKPKPPKARPANFKKKVKNAKCPICTTTFTDHSAWLSHMQSAHTSDDYQSEDGFFYCTICGWQNKTKELLMRHLRNRHTHNLQRCTDCNLGFRLLSMLAEHRAKVHDDFLPFKCEVCCEGFATRTRLRNHSITHWSAEDLPHKCEHCGAKFSDRNTYSMHIRRHKVDAKFRCEICQVSMASMADLRQHTRTHLNERLHTCDSCGKAFRSAPLLTNHLNEVHGGVTFPCDLCKKEFRTEKALFDHYEGHQTPNNCDVCGAKFFRKASLRKHKKLKHDHIPYDYSL